MRRFLTRKVFIGGLALGAVIAFAGTCTITNISLTPSGSNAVFAGAVQNNSGASILQHNVLVAFLDSGNNVLETKTVQPCLRTLPNGGTDYFSATSSFSSASVATGLARVPFDSVFKVGTAAVGSGTISNLSVTRNTTTLTVAGTFTNTDATTLTAPNACAVVFNSSGSVIVVGLQRTMPDLPQNANATFSISMTVPDSTTAVSYVNVYVDGFKNGMPTLPVAQAVSNTPVLATPGAGGQRALVDQADDVSGYQIHTMYVVPSDGVDAGLDTSGAVARSVAAFNGWLARQTGGPRLRLDTYGGRLDVTFVRLPRSDADIRARGAFVRDEIETELAALGFNAPKKIYAVYYGGSSSFACGGGAWPPSLVGRVAALYLLGNPAGAAPCASNPVGASVNAPQYFDFAMLHEIMHTIGLAPTCAPHETRAGHVSDSPTDLMYAGELPWQPSQLDVGRDDYFRAGIPGCPDLSMSVFLDPAMPGAAAPPGW